MIWPTSWSIKTRSTPTPSWWPCWPPLRAARSCCWFRRRPYRSRSCSRVVAVFAVAAADDDDDLCGGDCDDYDWS